MYRAKILADSTGHHDHRLTTFEVTFPRMVLADMTRHRMLSYSFESTRAVPTEVRIEQVREAPYVPTFMHRAKGMGGGEPLTKKEQKRARKHWLKGAAAAADQAEKLLWTGKEHAGRMLEPYIYVTGIVSGTEWKNFFGLRAPGGYHGDDLPDPKFPAQYELQVIAEMMRAEYRRNRPDFKLFGHWHLPLVDKDSDHYDTMVGAKISAGRCAAISYLKHHKDVDEDTGIIRWAERLAPSAHWSPGEHPAVCVGSENGTDTGNFKGWRQLRKFYPEEAIYHGADET